MAFLLPQSSPAPNLIANGSEIGGVFLGNLLRNQLPQIGNLVFNHQIPQDLIQKWQAKLDKNDNLASSQPPLIGVASTVVQPFSDSPSVGTAKALIQKFQEQINQLNPNITKPLTQKNSSLEGVGGKKILSDGESSSFPLTEISELPQRASWSSFDLSSSNNSSPRFLRPPSILEIDRGPPTPNHESFEGSLIKPSTDSLVPEVKFLTPPPQDLQLRRSPSPLIIANEFEKENVGEVAEIKGEEFVISQSGSCFAEILPTAISSPENTLSNLSSSTSDNIQTPNLPNPSPPKTLHPYIL
jgi:hypothetical protein